MAFECKPRGTGPSGCQASISSSAELPTRCFCCRFICVFAFLFCFWWWQFWNHPSDQWIANKSNHWRHIPWRPRHWEPSHSRPSHWRQIHCRPNHCRRNQHCGNLYKGNRIFMNELLQISKQQKQHMLLLLVYFKYVYFYADIARTYFSLKQKNLNNSYLINLINLFLCNNCSQISAGVYCLILAVSVSVWALLC